MGETQRTWRTTELWKELERRDEDPAPELRHLLEGILKNVEKLLTSSGTESSKFTLHDADHSWRVADRMARLAGEELAEISAHDLSMLLLSAYLHDIGMAPELAVLDDLLDLLLYGEEGGVSEQETAVLQAWLDDEHDGVVPPIAGEDESKSRDLHRARELLADYARHRHNDWSEAWIRGQLSEESITFEHPYPRWLDDLVELCRSHHFGFERLVDKRFDPRTVDGSETVLHLRYCACLLRVADVLDFSPERTPPILFRHRDIKGISALFWSKDREMSFSQNGDHMSLHARPKDALIHHAIQRTVEDVDRELLLCRRLAIEKPFQQLDGEDRLPHRWTLDTHVNAVVEPHESAYEFIDGSFRPDPGNLLELLGGHALYGSSLVAVRELLQNAFDAVREQIAYQRLKQPRPGEQETGDRMAQSHSISVRVERGKSGMRLVCRDSGVGMSKEAITSRFLIGGTSPGHALRSLERACREEGFSVGRTARFGIGALSYFLLADRLTVRTRPSIESGQARPEESPGWTFASFGLEDFGELKRTPLDEPGTEVELTIKGDELHAGEERLAERIAEYIGDLVRRAPCHFEFSAPDYGLPGFSLEPGWSDREDAVRDALLRDFTGTRDDQLRELDSFTGERAVLGAYADNWQALCEDAEERMELLAEEGALPDGLGYFRFLIGHFRLSAGQSLAYMQLKPLDGDRHLIEEFGNGDGSLAASAMRFSWNGMTIDVDWDNATSAEIEGALYPEVPGINTYIEVDWTNDAAGRLAVDRHRFTPDPPVAKALDFINRRVRERLVELVDANADSALALLNAHLIDRAPVELGKSLSWAQNELVDKSEFTVLAPIEFPAIYVGPDFELPNGLVWRGKPVSPVTTLNIEDEVNPRRNHRTWFNGFFGPQYIGAIELRGQLAPVLVWAELEPFELTPAEDLGYGITRAWFPPEWAELAVVKGIDRRFLNAWNPENPICHAADSVAWEWATSEFEDSVEPGGREQEILRSSGRAAAWLLMFLYRGDANRWDDLVDRSADFLAGVWDLIDGLADDGEVLALELYSGDQSLIALTRSGWRFEGNESHFDFTRRFGVPSDAWLVKS